MRLLLALAFVVTSISLTLGWASRAYPVGEPPPHVWVVLGLATFGSIFVATFAFNRRAWSRLRGQSFDEWIDELDAKGRLDRQVHSVTDALHYEDTNIGCSVYLLRSLEHGTLCILTQEGYEPTPVEDLEPGERRERRKFPTRHVELLRKKGDADVLDLRFRGKVFGPEQVEEPSPEVWNALGVRLDDGLVFATPDFDTVRARLRKATQ
jgi:hypothetical protein